MGYAFFDLNDQFNSFSVRAEYNTLIIRYSTVLRLALERSSRRYAAFIERTWNSRNI